MHNKRFKLFKFKSSIDHKPPYYQLENKHLKNITIFPTRLEMLYNMPKNGIVAEIGVAKGRFSEKIFNITTPAKLHLIDNWKSPDFNDKAKSWIIKNFKEQVKTGKIQLHHGNSTDLLKAFPDNYFSWIYLDTDHTYKTTKNELDICKNKIKHKGIIAGHDYTITNYRKGHSYGVVEAVNEFCYKNDWEFIFLTHETHRHLSFALKKIM